jgi:signal transduction histidine kinase
MSHQPAPTLPAATERRRIAALHAYGVLDTEKEAAFEDITRIASLVCGTPIAVVNLIDTDRQWFKAERGLGVRETPLDTSICAHAILEHDMLVVPDTTQDSRFAENPLVTGNPGLRFYAGALLKTADGLPIGTVCVLDTQTRTLSQDQLDILRGLARQVMTQLELRRMLDHSERSRRQLAGLLAAAGHDLKAPLRGALYAIDRARAASEAGVQARLDGATGQLMQIDQQFTRLAMTAGAGAGMAPDLQPVLLADVFQVLNDAWARPALRKRLALTIEPTALIVLAEVTLLETLLGNLLSNAVKYTPEGGRVAVTATAQGSRVAITVADNGIGMPAAESGQLFAAFRQADPSSEGLGLGLWIVQQTAEALGAAVSVDSAVGRGTTFTLDLRAA